MNGVVNHLGPCPISSLHPKRKETFSLMHHIIDLKELLTIIPYSRSHIARLEKAGDFPKRIKLGKRRVGWCYAEVLEWIDARKMVRVSTCSAMRLRRPIPTQRLSFSMILQGTTCKPFSKRIARLQRPHGFVEGSAPSRLSS
jgi:prophage regulatory protein